MRIQGQNRQARQGKRRELYSGWNPDQTKLCLGSPKGGFCKTIWKKRCITIEFWTNENELRNIRRSLNESNKQIKQIKARLWEEKLLNYIPTNAFEPTQEVVEQGGKRYRLWCNNKFCTYCEKELEYYQATLDHVVPKSKGGSNDESNLVISCREMQQQKRQLVA